ncbi:Transaldolase [Gemmatirosa kalamazoonensis]|uniref:Transaldolase n=1 Tax=Gemmatirosa kalamazoonensis TaxID=861299 RepID=W0RKD9_9BACT|nr:transaldolase family protein [Gemmatirosa kalamazoonensis]AHG90907.1 Transaldolase [Gemmatirosa kalamazoonensis]
MRILLASASPADIRWAADHGLADGIVTSPSLLANERSGADPRELLAEICRQVGLLPVHASVAAVDPNDMYRDGRELAKVADSIVVEVPLVDDAVVAIRRLASEGVRVAATLAFNAAQALLAAKSGASSVTIAVDQLHELGTDSIVVVQESRRLFDRAGAECDLVAAYPRGSAEFIACGLAGADAVTVDVENLRSLLVHPLTDRGVDRFLKELATRPKPRIAPV